MKAWNLRPLHCCPNFDPIFQVLAFSRLIMSNSFINESLRYSIFGVLTGRTIIFGITTSMETIEMNEHFLVCYFLSNKCLLCKLIREYAPDGTLDRIKEISTVYRFSEIFVFFVLFTFIFRVFSTFSYLDIRKWRFTYQDRAFKP